MTTPNERKPGLYGRPRNAPSRKRLRTIEGERVETPIALVSAARDVPGWALHDHETVKRSDGRTVARFVLYHRGGIVVNRQTFRDAFNAGRVRGFELIKIHDQVESGKARVYVTMRDA